MHYSTLCHLAGGISLSQYASRILLLWQNNENDQIVPSHTQPGMHASKSG